MLIKRGEEKKFGGGGGGGGGGLGDIKTIEEGDRES